MKNNIKNKKGITLIALVITIVVLIILASVSIALILGEDGIINKARLSRTLARKSQAEEQLIIQIHNIQVDKSGDVTLNNILDTFKDENKTDITVTEILTDQVGMLADSISEIPAGNLKEITVIVQDFEEFSFTIDTSCTITKVCGIDYEDYEGETIATADLSTKITIDASPETQTDGNTEKQEVELTIKSTKGWEEWSGRCAWSTSNTSIPKEEKWEALTLNEKNDKEKTAETEYSASEGGVHYLWVQITTCGKTVTKTFGPYNLDTTITDEDIICELYSTSNNETKGKVRVGSNKTYTDWTMQYILNDDEPATVAMGTTQLVDVVRGDYITVICTRNDIEIIKELTLTVLKEGFTLTYSATGANTVPSPQTVYSNTGSAQITITSTKPTKTGYNFVKWTTNSDGTGTEKNPGDKITITEATTLYAQWENKVKREMNYLYTTGTQIIHTDVAPDNNMTVEMKYQMYSTKTQFMFGSRVDSRTESFCFLYHNPSGYRSDFNDDQQYFDINSNSVHVVRKVKNKLYIDGTLKATNNNGEFNLKSYSPDNSGSTVSDLTLFGVNEFGNVNIQCAYIKFYYCKIWNGDTLVRDFIPVVDYNNTICLYDKVGDKLYYATCKNYTEAFVSDSVSTLVEPTIKSTGTQYVDTNYKPNGTTMVEAQFKINSEETQFVYGSRITSKSNTFSLAYRIATSATDKNVGLRFDYGNTISGYQPISLNTVYTTRHNKNNFSINNDEYQLISDPTTFTGNHNLSLFCVNSNGVNEKFAKMTLYYLKIYNNGSLVRDYVPISKNGRYCLYDRQQKQYVYSASGTDFVNGNT